MKRGAGRTPTSVDFLDFQHTEGRDAREFAPTATPEEVFERRWACTLLEQVVETLGREYREAGHDTLFAHLKGFLGGDAQTVPYREVASALAMTEGAVKVSVNRSHSGGRPAATPGPGSRPMGDGWP